MSVGLPGIDSCNQVNSTNLTTAISTFNNQKPVFWGRYFHGYSSPGPCEYSTSNENQFLHNNGIPILPIAEQTTNVGGTQSQGYNDGVLNLNDLIDTFGSKLPSSGVLLFLDVEGSGPALSAEYYFGWAQGIMSSTSTIVYPAVYASQGDSTTWNALNTALNQYGMGCNDIYI